MTPTLRTAKRALSATRRDLLARLESADCREVRTGGDEGDEVARVARIELGLLDRERLSARLREVDDALARIAGGFYGLCVECGDIIPPSRLKARPEVETDIRCQERREFARARLGRA